ncbi:MAG: hypothetical protein JRE23_07655, partial [Deltaproteobacteria bacterium]|nr:hypothetical protein [Deltaproteobacteria bacterium]
WEVEKNQRRVAPIRWPIYSGIGGRNTPEQVADLSGICSCPPVAKAVSVRWSREKKEAKLQADHVSRRYPRDRYVRGGDAAIRSIEATVWKLGSGIPVASRFASANRGSVIESQRNLAKKNFLSEDSYNE